MTFKLLICPICKSEFKQETKFLIHLKTEHNVIDSFQLYLDVYFNSIHPTCVCNSECNIKLVWSGWKSGFKSKFARGHNAKLDSSFFNKECQDKIRQKRIDAYKTGTYNSWNKGYSKDNNEKIATISKKISNTLKSKYANGQIIDWRKKDKYKALEAAKKISETKKKKYSLGQIEPWNKGFTKENNSSVFAISNALTNIHHTNPEFCSKRFTKDELLEKISSVETTLKLISENLEYKNKYQKLEFLCEDCGSIQEKSMMMFLNSPYCFSCKPKESKGQLEIYEFIKNICQDAILSDREALKPKELDVYIPSKSVAIEYNGLYWHSVERVSNVKSHQIKHDLCEAAGIQLLSIYEDEWRDKKDIVKSMIIHKLGMSNRVHTRKLKVKKLSQKESKAFFEQNHLEGYTPSFLSFGLVDSNNQIYFAVALRKPFHKKKYTNCLEISRTCTLLNKVVPGALSKLINYTKKYITSNNKNIKKLITYCDSRIGFGKSYELSGWKLIENSSSSLRFWWTDFLHRYNRFKYRADKENNLSESQVAVLAGVVKIYGCSNKLYEINF